MPVLPDSVVVVVSGAVIVTTTGSFAAGVLSGLFAVTIRLKAVPVGPLVTLKFVVSVSVGTTCSLNQCSIHSQIRCNSRIRLFLCFKSVCSITLY